MEKPKPSSPEAPPQPFNPATAHQELKEINLSDDESHSKDEETIIRTQMRNNNRYISFIDKVKINNRQPERANKSNSKVKSKIDGGSNSARLWQRRAIKDYNILSTFKNRISMSTIDNSTVSRRSKTEATGKIDGQAKHTTLEKNKDSFDPAISFKIEDRFREFKMLKESFLGSVFAKRMSDKIPQPIKHPGPPRSFPNKSFDDKTHRKSLEPKTERYNSGKKAEIPF